MPKFLIFPCKSRKKTENAISARSKRKPKRTAKRSRKQIFARSLFQEIIERELQALPERLEQLPAPDRIEVLLKLLPYHFPRMRSVEISFDEEIIREPIEPLTFEQAYLLKYGKKPDPDNCDE